MVYPHSELTHTPNKSHTDHKLYLVIVEHTNNRHWLDKPRHLIDQTLCSVAGRVITEITQT